MAKGHAAKEAALLRAAKPGMTLKQAFALRSEIIGRGSTVNEYLAGDPIPVPMGESTHNPVALMEAAGLLMKQAGGKDRALKALEAFDSLSQ